MDTIFARILRSSPYHYLLKADISRFYHSIYTHSIPWALHTKATAKVNRRRGLIGNAIDEDIRNTRDGQTIGIPIGPDTSRIVSEIIVTAIDQSLETKLPYLAGVRYVDDLYLYFKTLADLDRGHSTLQNVLSDFELELNPEKVERTELPEVFESKWVIDIRNFSFSKKAAEQRIDIVSYFSLAFQSATTFPKEYVLDYALAKIIKLPVEETNWDIFEALLLKAMLTEPKVVPTVLAILLDHQDKGGRLNKRKIKAAVQELLSRHCILGNTFEIVWALWLHRSLNMSLTRKMADMVCAIDDPIVALAVLDLQDQGLTNTRLNTELWKRHLNADDLYSPYWPLAYEAEVNGWLSPLPSNAGYVNADPFFQMLKSNQVKFYDTKRQVKIKNLIAARAELYVAFARR